jgi:hypothetical protein
MKFFIYFFVCFHLLSCGKLNQRAVEGHIMNPITGEPVEGVKISMVKTTGGLPGAEKTIASAISDANGYYRIEEKSMKYVFLQVNTFGTYHPVGWFQDGNYSGGGNFPVEKGEMQTVDFHAVPYGQIILDIENINCLSSNDSMQFRRKYQFDNTFPENWSTFRLGCYTYISPEPFNLPMGYHVYETKVSRNGLTTFYYDTVYLNNNVVATAEIRY